ncbi:MAG: GAF domain-containing protein, partial [Anaerolineae bacterium]|nr:GAF domain-containing protein [Anaerolineae bacterium]
MNIQATPPSPQDDVNIENYRRLTARYERLMEISRQLNSTLDLGALLDYIVGAATELTDTEEASILLVDPATGELRFEAASNMSRAEMEAIPVPMEGSLGGWVATHGEPLLVKDASSDSRWFRDVDKTIEFATRDLLAVPMKIHNQIIGVLEAINKRNDQSWAPDDVNTLSALASQAAIAVQNARLFQQSDFIAEMVHELRTPLAGLKASIALLLRPSLPPERRRDIMLTMQDETQRLTVMTNDFLDLARLESGRTRLNVRHFELQDLIAECTEVVVQQAGERAITISIHECPYVVSADRDKIKQVMLNLLTNAIKYNREGGQIICSAQRMSNTEFVTVNVHDTGHGISEEDQQRV